MANTEKPISIRMPAGVLAEVDGAAAKLERSRAWVIVKLLELAIVGERPIENVLGRLAGRVGYGKKNADISGGGGTTGVGGTPRLPAVGKAQLSVPEKIAAEMLDNLRESGIRREAREESKGGMHTNMTYSRAEIARMSEDLQASGEGDVPAVKPDMQTLREICAGNIPSTLKAIQSDHTEVDLCGFKSYNDIDGENYICGKEVHGPKVKHGEWIKV